MTSKKQQQLDTAKREMAKTLRKCQVKGARKERKLYEGERAASSFDKYPSLFSGHYKGETLESQEYKKEVSRRYVVGPAFNKGGNQVLGKTEANDPTTGKRR